ncbi:MAG TPA: CDP-alcohol phosphatidyltransferase family protein [Acidimicrobiales bacterium]|nr:CDP-alcohol phosphatidyltransferase family protein [Acidimicrobiales bacterium]
MGDALKRTGVSPDHLTGLGLLLALPAAWAIATGRLGLGLGLLIASAVPDLLDGAVAKASGRSSVRGAFFDSVADRVTDTLVLGALSWYLLDRHRGHVALLPVAVLGASLLISYERAKAEALGYQAKGGLMERAERVVVLCAALAFSFLMIPLLWLMLALTGFTAVQRFVKVWRQSTAAGDGPPPAERPVFVRRATYFHTAHERSQAPVSVRWRAWREANGLAARGDRPTIWARYTESPRPGSAAARWHERRQARLARRGRITGDDSQPASPARRGAGPRRP